MKFPYQISGVATVCALLGGNSGKAEKVGFMTVLHILSKTCRGDVTASHHKVRKGEHFLKAFRIPPLTFVFFFCNILLARDTRRLFFYEDNRQNV